MSDADAEAPPRLEHLCDLRVRLAPPIAAGADDRGRRRIIPIIGGEALGPRLSGRVLDLGADWQSVSPDLAARIDTRYAIETDDGALIEIINRGHRHGPRPAMEALERGESPPPGAIYFRTAPCFETRDARYGWLTRSLFLASGRREPDCVRLRVWEVL